MKPKKSPRNGPERPLAEEDQFDVIVIGSGPGGYAAAGRAGQLGLRTAVIEKAELGGICLNWGCIPTKALLHGAEVARTVAKADRFGVNAEIRGIELHTLVAHSRQTAGQLSGGVGMLMKHHGATVITGTAMIVDKGKVQVTDLDGARRELSADHIIVASGASPRTLPGVAPDGDRIWTYREALRPTALPDSLVVIGSGAIGSEFASLYADLGAQVTLLEALDRLMPGEIPEVAQVLEGSFTRRGIDCHVSVKVHSVEPRPDGVKVQFTSRTGEQHMVVADRVLVAVGVQPNTNGLGLERFGVLDERGFVQVNEHGATEAWGLYAIGDAAGGPCLAHKATTEALRCVNFLSGFQREPVDPDWKLWVPRCTYTTPEVASIGLDAAEAKRRGHVVAGRPIPFSENGRALGAGQTEGFAKVIIDAETRQILGATLVCEGVTELVGMLAVARAGRLDAETFVNAIIPHPTKSEILHEGMLAALGRPVNSV